MKAALFFLFCFCLPVLAKSQLPFKKRPGDVLMESAAAWKEKNDSARSNAEIRKAIAVYVKNGQIRDAAEAWLTLENYYAAFNGPGYGPRIAYYLRALQLFNQAGVTDRARDTRQILGEFYMASAQIWKDKKDSLRSSTDIRKGISFFLQSGRVRDAAEGWITLENYYAFFKGQGYGPRIAYYEQALTLFNEARATDRAAATLDILGDFYLIEGQYPKAIASLKRALALYQSTSKKDLQDIYYRIGRTNITLAKYDEALKYSLQALKIAEAVVDTTLLMNNILGTVANTYFNIGKFEQALFYYNRTLQGSKRKKALDFIVMDSFNAANSLRHLNRPSEGYRLMKEIQKVYHPADVFNRVMINISCLNSLVKSKNYTAAKSYCDTLLKLEPQLRRGERINTTLWQSLGIYFLETDQKKKAQIYTAKYEDWNMRRDNKHSLLTAVWLQFKLDTAKHNYKHAANTLLRYMRLQDSIFDQTKEKQIAQLEIQYQTEKKNHELETKEGNIKLLKKQAQLQAVNIRQKENTQKLTIAGAVLLTMLLGLSYNRYRLKQRVNKQLEQQQAEINLKNQSLTKLIEEKDNLLEEKEWLMKEIHHRVKNNLQIVISLLNTQSSFLKDEMAHKAISESQHRMQSISLIHQKLYQSSNLALVDMPAYISDLLQYLNSCFDIAGRIRFAVDIARIELDVTRSVPLGLILNEAITNSIKYAFPENREGIISVSLLEPEPGDYELTIRDNGTGLAETVDISKSKTLGMSLMRGLSKQLGGSFSVESNEGIKVTLRFRN